MTHVSARKNQARFANDSHRGFQRFFRVRFVAGIALSRVRQLADLKNDPLWSHLRQCSFFVTEVHAACFLVVEKKLAGLRPSFFSLMLFPGVGFDEWVKDLRLARTTAALDADQKLRRIFFLHT